MIRMEQQPQSPGEIAPVTDLRTLLAHITQRYPALSPQLRQAAKIVLERPEDVALRSMRALAGEAGVPPSTMVRLAKALDQPSYESFRRVFQEAMRTSATDFVARAEWLQRLPEGGRASGVVGGMAEAILSNVETAFRGSDPELLRNAAEALRKARSVTVVGVGGMHAPAAYFHYVARMTRPNVVLAEPLMASMIDELAGIGPKDAVLVLSVAPYAGQSVESARFAHRSGAHLIAVTDSRAAPIAPIADTLLLVPTATPQFFPSQAATVALLETLIALLVSSGDKAVLSRIEEVEQHRRRAGVYWPGEKA
ncbi:MAG: MurR/RpiR family transcriptional regulator [Hyphomicrobiaceae bacterium]